MKEHSINVNNNLNESTETNTEKKKTENQPHKQLHTVWFQGHTMLQATKLQKQTSWSGLSRKDTVVVTNVQY